MGMDDADFIAIFIPIAVVVMGLAIALMVAELCRGKAGARGKDGA